MNKIDIIKTVIPKVVLKPETVEAIEAVPARNLRNGLICIDSFPYRVGRESRVHQVGGKIEIFERPKRGNTSPNNDLYLVDRGHLLSISREHFLIEQKGESFFLKDRGSACGTRLNHTLMVGGRDKVEAVPLEDGAIITVGTEQSKYCFRFIDLTGAI